MRSRVRHELKIHPEFFEPVLRGHMKFQLRRDDRPIRFYVGDELLLKEWNPEIETVTAVRTGSETCIFPCVAKHKGYTGREVLVRVDYVMPADSLIRLMGGKLGDFVIMSISRVT